MAKTEKSAPQPIEDAPELVTDAQAESPAALPTAEPAPAAPHPSAAIVDAWFRKHFHNMGAALDLRAYTLLHGATEDLKQILAAQ